MDANKKIDLDHPLCPNESKILENVLQNHPLRFSIAASSLMPWIYLGQFWHTLKEDRSKYQLKFMLDRKELTMTLDDFRSIFYLPQATNNNHDRFVPALKFLIPEFTKLIVESLNELHPKISRRARNKYHNLEDDEMVKTIFNSGKNKDVVGMKIPDWMITDEMNLTENYRMTTSSPRTPNPEIDEGESSALQKSTVIRLHTIQLSLAEQKSRTEDEARKNKENVKEHLMAEEIEKLVAKTENVEEHEITATEQPVNVNEEEEESVEDDYKLKRRAKGKHVEETRNSPTPTPIRSPRIQFTLVSLDTKKLQDSTITSPQPSSSTPSSSLPKSKLSATN
ncbi:hypothetical protein Tco_0218990 [Tanacetum coccineum]